MYIYCWKCATTRHLTSYSGEEKDYTKLKYSATSNSCWKECTTYTTTKSYTESLKLGNLFLTDKMELKVGDFGLATRVEYVGERKRTVCGTPNYIAPEILEGKNGHSYEVDIWSIGVIIYTLIIGKPPFETSDVKTTYKKIKSLSYDFPQNVPVSNLCKDIITKILQLDPIKRPKIQDLLVDPFINPNEYTPPLLMPQSTLACPPSKSFLTQILIAESNKSPSTSRADKENGKDSLPDKNKTSSVSNTMLVEQVQSKSNDSFKTLFTNAHYIHVDTYIDYSNKYGIGYLLTNKSYGVMFSDSTKIIQEHKCSTFVYYDRIKQSSTVEPKYQYSISTHPAFLDKKVKIFLKFKESLKVPNAEEEQPTSDDPIHLKKLDQDCECVYVSHQQQCVSSSIHGLIANNNISCYFQALLSL